MGSGGPFLLPALREAAADGGGAAGADVARQGGRRGRRRQSSGLLDSEAEEAPSEYQSGDSRSASDSADRLRLW